MKLDWKTFFIGLGLTAVVGLSKPLVEFDFAAIQEQGWTPWLQGLAAGFIRPVFIYISVNATTLLAKLPFGKKEE